VVLGVPFPLVSAVEMIPPPFFFFCGSFFFFARGVLAIVLFSPPLSDGCHSFFFFLPPPAAPGRFRHEGNKVLFSGQSRSVSVSYPFFFFFFPDRGKKFRPFFGALRREVKPSFFSLLGKNFFEFVIYRGLRTPLFFLSPTQV